MPMEMASPPTLVSHGVAKPPINRRAGIPYRIVGGHSFFDRCEIKDVLGYLTCLMNRDDDISLLRIINTPARGIGVTTIDLAILESGRSKRSLYQTLLSRSFLDGLSKRTREAIVNSSILLTCTRRNF